MAEVFSAAFTADQHPQWPANQYSWDPSQLQALPYYNDSPATGSEGHHSEPASEAGHASSTGDRREQSLGPLPVGWQDSSESPAGGNGSAAIDAKEAKGAHFRAVKGPLVCQVEGCGHDLTVDKGYYQRYRVCEPHMKVLSLLINDKPSRFCQQCGRFQELTEFDGNKRSCRARLLQHNARRRKRDPFDTNGREHSRRGRQSHPWSDSSNDAEPVSGGAGRGAVSGEKATAGFSVDSGADQAFHARSSASAGDLVQPTSNTCAPTWAAAVPMQHSSDRPLFEAASLVDQFQPAMQRPISAQQQQAFQMGTGVGLVHCLSGGSDLVESLDDVLEDLFNGEPLDDPRMALPPATDSRDSCSGPGLTLRSAASNGLPGGSLLLGRNSISQAAAAAQFRLGGMGDSPAAAVQQNPAQQMLFGACDGGASGLAPSSGTWLSGSPLGADTGNSAAADLDAALNRRKMEQLQLQQQQQLMQHQQQMLQQQQFLQRQQQHQLLQHQQQQQLLLQQQQLRHQQLLQQQQFPGGINSHPAAALTSAQGLFKSEPYVNSTTSVMSAYAGVNACISGSAAGPCSGGSAWTSSALSTTSGMGTLSSMQLGGNPLSGSAALGAGLKLNSGISAAGSGSTAAPGGSMSSFDLARRLVAGGGAAAQYQSEELLVRVSIKIANCTPDQLPPDLYERLRSLLSTADASLVQGFLRPGCTHLVLDVLVSGAGGESSAAAAADDALDGVAGHSLSAASLALTAADLRRSLGSLAQRCAMLVQTEEEVALWPAGSEAPAKPRERAAVARLQAASELPVIAHVSAAAHVDAGGSARLMVYGTGLAGAGVHLFARMQGGYLPVTVQPLVLAGKVAASAAADPHLANAAVAAARCGAALRKTGRMVSDVVMVTVEGAPGTGLLLVEAQAGPLLSNWRPCLLSTDAGVAAEMSAWGCTALQAGGAALASLEAFVTDLGRVLDKRSYVDISNGGWEDESAAAGDARGEEEAALELVCVCERLLAWAADAGLAHVSTFLVAALRQYGQDVQAILEVPYADGLAIVHRCIRSGSAATVGALLGWAAANGVRLSWGGLGGLGLSPLHLAALVPAAWRTLAADPAVRWYWESVRAHADGATPKELQARLLASLPLGAVPREVADAFAPVAQQQEQQPQVEEKDEEVAQQAVTAEEPAPSADAVSRHVSQEDSTFDDGSAFADAGATTTTTAKGSQNSTPKSKGSTSTLGPLISLGALHAVCAMIFTLVAVLFAAAKPSAHVPLPAAADDESFTAQGRCGAHVLRLAPVSEFLKHGLSRNSSSLLGVALLGLAVFILPVKSAAMMLSQGHPV